MSCPLAPTKKLRRRFVLPARSATRRAGAGLLAGQWLLLFCSLNGRLSSAATPTEDLAAMRVLPGFKVTLFAAEEQGVVKPIQIRFDPDGRLWVVGSRVYPQVRPGEAANDKVIVLEDTDRDGRADKSTVFADSLAIPTGLELGDGGVYVGAGSELLHLRDTDGDGRADERRVVLRGFGTGDTHQTINSFNWGPAGELTFSQGLHALSRIETPWGVEELRQSGVWRWWPRRLRLDAFWSGAMGAHNPFGTAFDRWGQPFIFAGNGHGIYHLTQAMIRTDHFLEHRWLWNEGRKFGGAEIVENARWPAANQGEFITGGYLHNSVERFRITDAGGTNYSVLRLPPLVESTNTAFRIVDVRFGPDGALYLADWYNPVIGHYQASFRDPARDTTSGRIWRVAPAGSSDLPGKKLSAGPVGELVTLLRSPERSDRQMAKRVLAGRPTEEVTAALRPWLDSLPPAGEEADLARVETLGVFASHEVIETNLLTRLAAAERPEVRALAARVTGHWADRWPGAAALLARLVPDPHPRVRLEAVVACSYLPYERAVEIAALATDLPMDAAIEYAFTQCVHALAPRWRAAHEDGRLTFGGGTARQTAFARALGGRDAARQAAGRLARVVEVALDADTVRQLARTVAAAGTEELTALLPVRNFMVGTDYLAGLHAEALGWAAQAARD
ncbi:MAG: PVC-type heme-binding CxxCH protein, partial [Limisphaerales bacterium]